MKNKFYELNRLEQLVVLEKVMEKYSRPTDESHSYWNGVEDGINKIYRLLDSETEIDFSKLDDKNYIETITS